MTGFAPIIPPVPPHLLAEDHPAAAPVEPVQGFQGLPPSVAPRPVPERRLSPTRRLLAATEALLWSHATLALALGVPASTTRLWVSGRRAPPDEVLDWLDDLAHFHRDRPAPVVRP